MQAGADINAPCGPRGECRTPLHVAAEHGHVANIQVESKSPSEPYYRDRYCVVCNMYICIVQGCGTVFADPDPAVFHNAIPDPNVDPDPALQNCGVTFKLLKINLWSVRYDLTHISTVR